MRSIAASAAEDNQQPSLPEEVNVHALAAAVSPASNSQNEWLTAQIALGTCRQAADERICLGGYGCCGAAERMMLHSSARQAK
jgi:hypothetical protein